MTSISTHLAAAAAALAIATGAVAQVAPPPAAAGPKADARPAVGTATRTWLELQRSGRAAEPVRGIPGEIATLSWRRYVDSYKHPIPEAFDATVRDGGAAR